MTLFRFDFYGRLRLRAAEIIEDALGRASALGIPDDLSGRIGISGSNSSAPGTLRRPVVEAITSASTRYPPLITAGAGTLDPEGQVIGDRLRLVVRAVFLVLEVVQDWAERVSTSG